MRTLYTGLTCPNTDYLHTPLIEIRPVQDDTQLRRALASLNTYDYLLLTSRQAVAPLVAALPAPAIPPGTRLVTIGPATAAALRAAGFAHIEQPEEDNSHAIVRWFAREPCGRVLIPRSNLALPIIPEGLRHLGFEVDCVTAYETHIPEHPQKADLSTIDRIVFTSPSTVDNFVRLYGSLPTDKELTARGPITLKHLQTIIKQQEL